MAVTTINIDSQILTFADFASFPPSGTVKTIYIAEDTNFQYYWNGSAYELLTTDILIPANLTFYATTAASPIMGYQKLVISIDDPDYDEPAVDVTTGAITGTGQLIAELASDAGIFAGNPGQINITTIGEIRRTSGSGVAEFYYEVYQRDSGGTETLIATSNTTNSISNTVYQQFQASALFNNGTWLNTDRVVIKYYGSKIGGGSNPTYDFLFGGSNPVRTLFPISAQLLLNVPISIGVTGVTGGTNDFVLKVDSNLKLAQSELKTVGGNSLFGSGDIAVGGGITIGTTAIASGTVNRVLFEGAGNVVQQDAGFVWNNTDKRLILGADQASVDTNPRLVVVGKNPSGTTTLAAFHNSTGNSNALVIRDDGFIGINTDTQLLANTCMAIGNSAQNRDVLTVNSAASFDTAAQITLYNGSNRLGVLLGTTATNRRGIGIYADSNGRGIYTTQQNGRTVIGFTAQNVTTNSQLGTILTQSGANGLADMLTVGGASLNLYNANNSPAAGGFFRVYLLDISNNLKESTRYDTIKINNAAATFTTACAFSTIINNVLGERMRISEGGGLLINTTTDIASSILTLASTTKGFLPPRMTGAQAEAIATPAEGLMVYATNAGAGDITAKGWWGFDGTNWVQLD